MSSRRTRANKTLLRNVELLLKKKSVLFLRSIMQAAGLRYNLSINADKSSIKNNVLLFHTAYHPSLYLLQRVHWVRLPTRLKIIVL